MVTFNSFQLRKDQDGKSFLDLEVTLTWYPQRIIMRHSFPATSDYYPEPQQGHGHDPEVIDDANH
jgi:hypothetical protein